MHILKINLSQIYAAHFKIHYKRTWKILIMINAYIRSLLVFTELLVDRESVIIF